MTILQQIIPVYLARFKKEYGELEKKWIADGKPGFERQKWLREKIPFSFSKNNLEKLSREEAIEIFHNFSTLGPKNPENDRSLAANIVDQNVIDKVKELLHGTSDFSERYSKFLDKESGTKNVGEGITSEILAYYNPQEYGIISAPTTKALRILGVGNFSYSKTGKLAGKYAREYFDDLQKVLTEFRKDTNNKDADFIDLDYFLYFISQSQIWQVAGGNNGQSWLTGTWQKNGIAGYGSTGIEKEYGEQMCTASESTLAEMYRKVNPHKSPGYELKVAKFLDRFINKVQIGDVFIVNQGKTAILGFGIVNSGPKYSQKSYEGDPQVYRDVIWVKKEPNFRLPVPSDLTEKFGESITKLEFKSVQNIFSEKDGKPPVPPMNPTEKLILELLENKKQIILYGPPGTGKTFYANGCIKNSNSTTYDLVENSLLDQRVFILTTYAPLYKTIPDLNAGDEFTYVWKGKPNWQCYFEEIQVGDIALTYHATSHKFTTAVQCIRKEDEGLVFSVLHQFNGVTYQMMKSDSLLKESGFLRANMGFSLTRVGESELQRIIDLSKDLTYEKIGIVVSKNEEPVNNTKFVTFHPSFGYEDFIEGLRPVTENDMLKYRVEEGVFKEFSRLAFNVLLQKAGIEKEWRVADDIPTLNDDEKIKIKETSPSVPFYLIIDEINRGDMSRIFGELITLIEADKRYCERNELVTTLPYSKRKFAISPNLLIIGTMNTADKSIALVDIALRRRFGFIEMMPDCVFLRNYLSTEDAELQKISTIAIDLLQKINETISSNFDRDHQIGHSYFTKLKEAGTRDEAIKILHFAWYREILPLLQEYYYDSPKRLQEVVGDKFVTLFDKRGFQFKGALDGESFLDAIKEIVQKRSIAAPDNRMN